MHLPITIKPGSSVLVAGAGGGFDGVCALPVALALRGLGMTVHLANYSFVPLKELEKTERPLPNLARVNHLSELRNPQVPFVEGQLARWLEHRGDLPGIVWCLGRAGVKPTLEAYRYLRSELTFDTLVLVDGGVDGLFLGNEYDIASPSMDAISLTAGCMLECPGFFVSTAFGTEGRDNSVRHYDVLKRMAELVARRAFHGVSALLPGHPVGDGFLDALGFIHRHLKPSQHSVIASSIRSAMQGDFGDVEVCLKAQGAPVWVSPLTLLYWFFDLERVAKAKPFYHEIADSQTVLEVAEAIQRFRDLVGAGPRQDIPI
jgi:hypothetical protein